jgi:glycine betaine/proline transport system substrate-binding protein
MKKGMNRTSLLLLALCLMIAAIGCSRDQEDKEGKEARQDKGDIKLAYVEWSSEVASTNVVRVVLENQGYDVNIVPVSGAAMWQSVASGDADGMVAAWLPTTHGHYLEELKDQVVNLGSNLEGTKIGLVVPSYVTINSITELHDNADKFDGKIIGIDPGAGLMSKTEKVMTEYNLDNFKLIAGSGATMTGALQDAINNDKWIVVTGWTPHWKFGRWDLKYLDDPKNVYGGAEHISTIVRQGLKEEMPEAYAILDNFYWTPEEMARLMVRNQEEGADPYENAKQWVEENQAKVQSWIPE